MPVEIIMPALSPTMEEGQLANWLVKEGDHVSVGDVIAEIETDKTMVELEADMDGTIGKILVEAGTAAIPVHQPIALLLRAGESAADIENWVPADAPDSTRSAEPTPPVAAPLVVAPRVATPPVAVSVPIGNVKTITMREALHDAMAEEMRADPDVFVIGEEVAEYQGAYKVTKGLLEEFGEARILDTPITEHAIAGLAVGAAFAGLKPIVEFMTFNFAMQAIDQIINSAAKSHYMSGGLLNCPIVFRGPNGAAKQVAAQHAQDFSAWYAHIPGLIVLTPASAADAKGLLKAAIRNPNPVLFLEHELLYAQKGDVPDEDFVLPIGRAHVLREGSDITLVAYSRAVSTALAAADLLQKENIHCELIDLRSLRPLDMDSIVASVKKTNRLVIVEEGWPQCGIASEIIACVQTLAFDDLDAPIVRLSALDVPMPYAHNLEILVLPSVERVVEVVRETCR